MSSFAFFFLGRVLCETVKDFVSKVGTASANSDPSQADEPDSLAQKVCIYLYSQVGLLCLKVSPKKMNLGSFRLNRVYLDPLNMSNAGDFSWS